jgi:hypothetical protein
VQALKAAAIRGSLDSLKKLAKPADGNLAPHGELLPIFYHHLDPRKIPHPTCPTPNTFHILELAITALEGITACVHSQHGSENKVFVSDIESHWPAKIWKWTHFLLAHCFIEPMLNIMNTKFRFSVYHATMGLLTALVGEAGLRITVGSTPQLIAITTKLWIAEAKKGSELLCFMASMVLERFVSAPKPGWHDQIVAAAGNDPGVIAKTILERIRANLIEPGVVPTNHVAFHKDILIAIGFTDGPTTAVCRALWSQHSITTITKAMLCLLSDRHADGSAGFTEIPDAFISQCLTFCVMYLDISFTNSEDACTWIVQAIDAQLIPALLKSTRFFAHEAMLESICSNILGDIIPQYLVYRSVLRPVARSLKNTRRLGLEGQLSDTGSFRDSWITFNELASERLTIKAHYDKDPSHNICDNPQVSVR